MKKTVALLVIFAFLATSLALFADKKSEMYLSAITEKNPELKLKKLEDFLNKYGKKKKYQTATLFTNLVETAARLKKYDKVEKYAQLAFKSKKLSAIDEANVKLQLAYTEIYAKKNLKNAAKIADEIISFANTVNNRRVDLILTAPALRIKIAALEAQAEGAEDIEKALESSLQVFDIDKSARSANFVFHFSKKLYDEYNQVDKAIAAMEKICLGTSPALEHVDLLAYWYMQEGIDNKAKQFYNLSYIKKRSSQKAYTLGKLTYIVNRQEGMNFLAEAVALGEAPYSAQAMELLKEVYAGSLTEETPEEARTEEAQAEAINKMIEEARTRLNI